MAFADKDHVVPDQGTRHTAPITLPAKIVAERPPASKQRHVSGAEDQFDREAEPGEASDLPYRRVELVKSFVMVFCRVESFAPHVYRKGVQG